MNADNISFGRKIPISKCKIKDTKSNKFVPVTFYEIDCSDKEEIKEVSAARGFWDFKNAIVNNMMFKNKLMEQKYPTDRYHYYTLQQNNGKIAGILQVQKANNTIYIDLIESDPEKRYKYAGYNMIAGLCNILEHGTEDSLSIKFAFKEAIPFYKTCGFNNNERNFYRLYKWNSNKVKKQLEEKTQSPFIDLLG